MRLAQGEESRGRGGEEEGTLQKRRFSLGVPAMLGFPRSSRLRGLLNLLSNKKKTALEGSTHFPFVQNFKNLVNPSIPKMEVLDACF